MCDGDPLSGRELDGLGIDPDDRAVEHRRDPERAQLLLGARREARGERRKDAVAGLDEQDPRLARVHRAVLVREHVVSELGNLPGHLDAGRAGADDDEGEPRLAERVVGLLLRRLEGEQDRVAEVQRPFERLQLGRVLGPVVVTEVRVAGAAADDEDVVRQGALAAVRQVGHRDGARVEVEAGHLAEDDVRVLLPVQGAPQRERDFRRRERAGRDLVGQRLEQEEVLAVDERHLDVRTAKAPRGQQAAEASADDHDPLAHSASVAASSWSRCRFTSRPPA